MRLFHWGPDGGPDSAVRGFWLIEVKRLFSVVLLRFDADSREVFHSHAFPAVTWWLTGEVVEEHKDGRRIRWRPSLVPKITPRRVFHKVHPIRRTWALSLRGPWAKTWAEYHPGRRELRRLTNGRRVVAG